MFDPSNLNLSDGLAGFLTLTDVAALTLTLAALGIFCFIQSFKRKETCLVSLSICSLGLSCYALGSILSRSAEPNASSFLSLFSVLAAVWGIIFLDPVNACMSQNAKGTENSPLQLSPFFVAVMLSLTVALIFSSLGPSIIWLGTFLSIFWVLINNILNIEKDRLKLSRAWLILLALALLLSPNIKLLLPFKVLEKPLIACSFFFLALRFVQAGLGQVATQRKRRELSSENQKLRKMAEYDALTRLLNRRTFDKIFANSVREAYESKSELSFAVLDIDFFKKYNDAYGHPAGDELLKQFATVIKNAVRDVDTVVRLGGEEFGLLLPEANLENATMLCNRIRGLITDFPFPNAQANGDPISASFGVAAVRLQAPENERDDPSTVYTRADEALYEAKKTRNTVKSKA